MWIEFSKLSDTARIWIYQASRSLVEPEIEAIKETIQPSIDKWAAHGVPLLGSATVFHNRFLVIGVDEYHHSPSGCSIDASVHWVREIGLALKLDFFDRSVAYVAADDTVQTIGLPQLKATVSTEIITPETTIFNNLVATKGELLANWQLKAGDSWLKRYFKSVSI